MAKTESKPWDGLQLTLPCKDVARALGISLSGVYFLLSENSLQGYKIGGRTVVKKKDLEDFVAGLPSRNAGGAA